MGKGFSFLKKRPKYLSLLIFPLIISFLVYGVAIYMFTVHGTAIMAYVFPKPETWILLMLWYATLVLAYIVVLAIMSFTFMTISNIISCPFYDLVSAKLEREYLPKNKTAHLPLRKQFLNSLILVKEELKKAIFVALIPILLVCIPGWGVFPATVVGAVFIAWEYVDFSVIRHRTLFKDRLKIAWNNIFYLFGFGSLLMIPILNLFLFPFAIVGATLLYFEHMHARI